MKKITANKVKPMLKTKVVMKPEEIKKLQEQIEKDSKEKPRTSEKRLKVDESFEGVVKKMMKPKKKKK